MSHCEHVNFLLLTLAHDGMTYKFDSSFGHMRVCVWICNIRVCVLTHAYAYGYAMLNANALDNCGHWPLNLNVCRCYERALGGHLICNEQFGGVTADIVWLTAFLSINECRRIMLLLNSPNLNVTIKMYIFGISDWLETINAPHWNKTNWYEINDGMTTSRMWNIESSRSTSQIKNEWTLDFGRMIFFFFSNIIWKNQIQNSLCPVSAHSSLEKNMRRNTMTSVHRLW